MLNQRLRIMALGLLAVWLLPTASLAQETLVPGQTLRGGEWINRGALSSVMPNRITLLSPCFLFEPPANTIWQVEARVQGLPMSAGGYVSISRSCGELHETSAWFGDFGGPARLTFRSGGGAYAIKVRYDIDGGRQLPWTLTVTPAREGGRITDLRPGTIAGPAGVASLNARVEARAAGETFQDCATCPQMAVIPAGSFMMGSPADEEGRNGSEGPRHVVTLANAFAIGTREVTFDEYDACVADQGCREVQDAGWGRGRRPVINVSYLDAQRYVGWLSRKTGHDYFLPSEAEWEYAARAGTDTPWSTGMAIISDDANILGQFNKTVPVGGYPANAFGLHDIHGNVAEWTQDCMDTGYVGVPNDGSAATGGDCNAQAVVRGGDHSSSPTAARSASRAAVSRTTASNGLGFRVARAL